MALLKEIYHNLTAMSIAVIAIMLFAPTSSGLIIIPNIPTIISTAMEVLSYGLWVAGFSSIFVSLIMVVVSLSDKLLSQLYVLSEGSPYRAMHISTIIIYCTVIIIALMQGYWAYAVTIIIMLGTHRFMRKTYNRYAALVTLIAEATSNGDNPEEQ